MPVTSVPQRTLGKNGPKVPALGFGLGGLSIGYGTSPSDEDRFAVLDRAVELGATFWDTADIYGDSEELLGKWFKRTGRRNDVFLATKFGIRTHHDANGIDSSPEYCKQACDASLKRLGVDYIDLSGFYYDCGQNMKAIDKFKNEIKILEENSTLEAEKQRARALNELGLAYWDFGFLKEAIDTWDQALRDENSAASRRNIEQNRAVTLRDMGKLDDAERLLRQTLVETESTNYASLDYTNLGSILQAQGQHDDARQMYEQVIFSMRRNQTEESPSLLLTRHGYAEVSAIMGNHDEAIDIWSEVFEEKARTLGMCRPATLKTGICLQSAFNQTRRQDEAEEIANRIRPFLQYS